jgi:hypothetical protein
VGCDRYPECKYLIGWKTYEKNNSS